jgi:hypothetical protein
MRISPHKPERGEMKMQKKLVVIVAVLTSSVGFAADSYADCEKESCIGVAIEALYVKSDDTIGVSTSGDETTLDCDIDLSEGFLILNRSHPNQKEIYAALLSAKLANHNIRIRTRDVGGTCAIQWVRLE